MSAITCIVCDEARVEAGTVCPACQAWPEWHDLFRAARAAAEEFADLHERGLLSEAQRRMLQETVGSTRNRWLEQARRGEQPPSDSGVRPASHCRKCFRPAGASQSYCAICGGPVNSRADLLRYLDFATSLVADANCPELPGDDARSCVESLRNRIATLEAELRDQAGQKTERNAAGHRSLIEILLDPQSIRWLLASGGVLLAVGLVIWLSSLGIFKSAVVVAAGMGVGTISALGGGIAVVRNTRYRLAGRSLALLGCLVIPLNLWFYNAHQLITLEGHLWLAAMVCCILYAAAAFALEDPVFVYVLFGGITMTGMLVLADLHRLMEISSPATLLMTLGLISLHVERAFAEGDGPFSRKRFGLACFRSAHALIASGMLLLLGSQLSAWASHAVLRVDLVGGMTSNRFLVLWLVLAGGYAYLYSSLLVRSGAVCGYLAAACVLWAELLALQIGHVALYPAVLISLLALTSLAINVGAWLLSGGSDPGRRSVATRLEPIAFGLTSAALGIGLVLFLDVELSSVFGTRHFATTWNDIGSVALTAACSLIAASLAARIGSRFSGSYLVSSAAATFLAAAGLLGILGLKTLAVQSPVLMTIPMFYLIASRFFTRGLTRERLSTVALAAAIVLVFSGMIADGAQWIAPLAGRATDLWTAAFCLEAAVFFAVAAKTKRGNLNVCLSVAMGFGAIYQLLSFWKLPPQSYNIAFAVAGVMGLIGDRLFRLDSSDNESKPSALSACSHALVSLPMAGLVLLGLSRLARGEADLAMLWAPAILSLVALVSAAVVRAGGPRRWYCSLAIGQIGLCLLALWNYSSLSLPRKAELFSVLAGLVLLMVGYALWYREQNQKSIAAGFCLLSGALLAGLPPAIFAMVNRFGYQVSFVDELTLMTIAVLMFLAGMMCRVRATTLIGGGLLIGHLITLVVFAGMKAQLAVGVYVAIGGAVLFAAGLLLSVYRDLLLAMPQRISQRKGLFRVLAWR